MFNSKILKVMPYVLGALIAVLIIVMIIVKTGGKQESDATELKSENTVSGDTVSESTASESTLSNDNEADETKQSSGQVAALFSDTSGMPDELPEPDDGAVSQELPDKGTPDTGTTEPAPVDDGAAEGDSSEADDMTTPEPTPTPTPIPVQIEFEAKDDYIETKNDVNLRIGPSTDTDVFANLKTGKRLKRTGYNEKWTRIVYDGTECYIYTPLVTGVFDEPTGDGNAAGSASTGTATLTQGVGTPNGHIICIDPGHQTNGNNEKEPLGPGSSEMKAKVSSGTSGNTTGHPEYKLNLTVSLKLRDELVARGYTVVMTRETNDVNISNAERAKIAADAGAQAFIRIHANSATDTGVNGVETICMTNENEFNAELYSSSRKLSDSVLNHVVSSTGAKKRYVWETDTMTGINWAEGPVTILEMGYMSNKDEEEKLLDDNYQNKIVLGIADGIDEFFK